MPGIFKVWERRETTHNSCPLYSIALGFYVLLPLRLPLCAAVLLVVYTDPSVSATIQAAGVRFGIANYQDISSSS